MRIGCGRSFFTDGTLCRRIFCAPCSPSVGRRNRAVEVRSICEIRYGATDVLREGGRLWDGTKDQMESQLT